MIFCRETAGESVENNKPVVNTGPVVDLNDQSAHNSQVGHDDAENDIADPTVSLIHTGPRLSMFNSQGSYALQSTMKNKKDKKKVKKGLSEPIEPSVGDHQLRGRPDGENVSVGEHVVVSKNAIEVTAEDLADEEWGPVNEKGKKAKKGKPKKGKPNEDDDEQMSGK